MAAPNSVSVPMQVDCQLTAKQKAENSRLSYNDFDQAGTTSGSFRQLSEGRCALAAADAVEDYLITGPRPSEGQHRNLLFHMGQSLAIGGREREAARVLASSLSAASSGGEFDWNTYVVGTWAFLVKDGARLEAAHSKLAASTDRGNIINGRALAGLMNCFNKPYAEAYQSACRPK